MYGDDIKLFTKKWKDLEILLYTIKIQRQDEGMEFVREKCAMRIVKK